MVSKQINPKLIHALTDQPLTSIPATPSFKHLRGTYVKSIVDQLKKIETPQPKNEMMMTCTQCGRSGNYDIGVVAVEISAQRTKKSQQLTGYFRCKHCNAGGPWETSTHLYMLMMAAILAPEKNLPVHIGVIQLSDGYKPPYATDGEEHYLQLITTSPTDSLLWNKLGNLYLTGSRPELAMAAFEKSVALDPNQVESHLSIANLLMQIRHYKEVIHHLHQMMLAADSYPHLETTRLRELLAHGICTSFIASAESKNKYNPLPTDEQLAARGRSTVHLQLNKLPRYLSLSSENISTFYPLADAFIGKQLKTTKKQTTAPQKRTKSQQVEAFIDAQQDFFTKAQIQEACPDVSIATITKVVRELRKAGVIEMVGSGAEIRWYKR